MISDLLYSIYERRLASELKSDRIPRHVGVILDGNRRWAAGQGGSTAQGHAAGAAKIEQLLGWCDEVGVEVVTLWLLATMRPLAAHRRLSGLLQTSRVAPAAAATPLCFVRAPHAGPPSVTLFTEALSEVWGVVKDPPTGQPHDLFTPELVVRESSRLRRA